MAVACAVLAVVFTVVLPLLLFVVCWQSERRCCKIPLRSTGRLYDAAAGSKRTRLAALSRHDPRDLYTTVFWSKHSRTILICWHAAVLALVIFTIAFELAGPDSLAPGWYGGTFFAYLTNWTWWLLGARALLGIAVCITGGSDTAKADAAPRYTLLDKFFAVLTAVLPTATVIVAVGYWAAVRGSIGEVYLDEPIKHGVNAVIMLAEVMLTRLPVTTTWVVFPVLYLAVYTIFQVIYWAGSEDWVYERTDFRNCVILPGYFLLPIVAVGVFFAIYGLAKLRNKLFGSTRTQSNSPGGGHSGGEQRSTGPTNASRTPTQAPRADSAV